MKKTVVIFALVALVALGGQAFAEMCAVEDTPAATLLLPYFEQDCSDPNGLTTLFSVNNASAATTLAHVTVWSNQSVPVFDFDIYLTGYDVQTVNLRDVLCNGNLPVTGPDDSVSNQGVFSDPHTTFGGTCSATLGNPPAYQNPVLTGNLLGHIQAWLSGQQSPATANCASTPTDNLVGYITIDDTEECSLLFPSDDSYWLSGIPTNHNQLWGDWFMVDTANNFAQGDTLVHLEAEDDFTGAGGDGLPYTFYGRYTENIGFIDNREPTATNFAVRHIVGGLFDGGTDLLVWRDSTSAAVAPFTCGTNATWYPLETKQIVIFDEEENPVTVAGPPISGIPEQDQPEPFPLETQRVSVGGPAFSVPASHNFGWLYLNLNHAGNDNPWRGDMAAQAWVSAIHSALGRFSVGLDAIQLDSACDPIQVLLTDPTHPSQQIDEPTAAL